CQIFLQTPSSTYKCKNVWFRIHIRESKRQNCNRSSNISYKLYWDVLLKSKIDYKDLNEA
ncbi:unnamed protein product, partial [Musa hybrid cultivar]